jgi:hypothetical protein
MWNCGSGSRSATLKNLKAQCHDISIKRAIWKRKKNSVTELQYDLVFMMKVYPNSSLKHARISKEGYYCRLNNANNFEILHPGNIIKNSKINF